MESPFNYRLDSNYTATSSESLKIHALLEGSTSRLEKIDNRLQELNRQRTRIQAEQAPLRLFISKYRALISLVRKLPIDILQEIFIACLPTAHNSLMSAHEPPILLTHVCSSWRNVAHATPRLWRSIHINVTYDDPLAAMFYGTWGHSNCRSPALGKVMIAHQRAEVVLEWMAKSAGCPLDISFNHFGDEIPDGSYDNRIIKYLIRFSERWRKVSFSAPYLALAPVAALSSSKLPLLESLNLNCDRLPATSSHPLEHHELWVNSAVMKAPKLRAIFLTQLKDDVNRLPINWSQLTNLSLERNSAGFITPFSESLTIQHAYEILASSRNLISCRLKIVDNSMESSRGPLSESIVSLPFLTELFVYENASLAKLFSLLRLPSLKSLEFHTTILPQAESTISLLSLLMFSKSAIQDLTTDARLFKRQDFIKCLRLCPFLKSLTIRRSHSIISPQPVPWEPYSGLPACRIDDSLLKMFTSSSSSNNDEYGDDTTLEDLGGYLCPNLEYFECTSQTAFSEATLLQFIKMKNGDDSSGKPSLPGLAKLKKLVVTFKFFPCWPPDNINPKHELYKQAGLEATISYPPPPATQHFSTFDGLPNENQQSGDLIYY